MVCTSLRLQLCAILKAAIPSVVHAESAALFIVDGAHSDVWTPIGDIDLPDSADAPIVAFGAIGDGSGVLSPMARPSVIAGRPKAPQQLSESRVPLGKGIIGAAIASGQCVTVKEVYDDARFDAAEKVTARLRTVMYVPVKRADGTVIAVVQLSNKQGGECFMPDDEATVEAIRYAGFGDRFVCLHCHIIFRGCLC